MENIMYVEE